MSNVIGLLEPFNVAMAKLPTSRRNETRIHGMSASFTVVERSRHSKRYSDEDIAYARLESIPYVAAISKVCGETTRLPMRSCPTCSRRFDDTVRYCPHDGEGLVEKDPIVGSVLDGKYRIDALLGAGGMGAVYRATQFALARPVAVKVIRGRFAIESVQTQRFKREALMVAQLRHPHIVTIHDFGTAEGVGAYLVMELLDGRSLREELEGFRRLSIDIATEILRQSCSAIHVAHAAGVVHRDLKPDNIFLEVARGAFGAEAPIFAKILDFGVAKLAGGFDGSIGSLTQPGALVGTPAYTAPEQLAGEIVDGRADIYSLGCVAYEMVTGQPPFMADTLRAIITKHMLEPPIAPRELNPDIPEAIDQAILRALAKSPADRYPTAASFGRALQGFAQYGSETMSSDPIELRSTMSPVANFTGVRVPRDTAFVEPRPKHLREHNLPEPLTSFVERADERAAVERLLEQSRLVTITGTGGIGKTRLALEVARNTVTAYPDGAWLVELASFSDPELVPGAVAAVFGIKPETGVPVTTSLEEYLSAKRLLLLFDNCEHVVDACSHLADAILRTCPTVKIFATSQETLGVLGEAVYRLPSMTLPKRGTTSNVDAAKRFEAVRLFVDRARLADPSFEVDDSNVRDVVELCRKLDGIPLAIELAASRVRVLPLSEIIERLSDRFRLLSGGSRQSTARQQTLLATMDWSYGLLANDERELLRGLAVFSGQFTIRAAEAILGSEERGATYDDWRSSIHISDVLDLLTRLVDKSLVVVDTESGGLHYRLLETVRHYAWQKVAEAGEDASLIRRHAHWFVEFAERGASALNGPEEAAWFARLDSEHDNLRAVLQRVSTPPSNPLLLIRLCCALGVFWNVRGHWSEALRWTESALALVDGESRLLEGRAHYYAGCFAINLGEMDRARAHLSASLDLLRAEGDNADLVRALHKLGFALMSEGRYGEARPVYQESLDVARRIGDPQSVAAASSQLAQAATDRGDFATAARHYDESLAIYSRFGNRRAMALVLHNAGEVAQRLGDLDRAEAILGECLTLAAEVGDRHCAGFTLHVLGNIANDRGNFDAAIGRFVEALAVHCELDDRQGMIYVLEGMACAMAGKGDAARSLRLAGAAAVARAAGRAPLTPAESAYLTRYIARAESFLSGATGLDADQLLAEGRAMSVRQALDHAFDSSESSQP
jgi:predicted ATPase/serine/threonine protein kinase